MEQGTQMLIGVVQGLRAIAQAFPTTAPKIAEINNLMREVVPLMMEAQQTGEPMAPPNAG
jgi:hypothetical protein